MHDRVHFHPNDANDPPSAGIDSLDWSIIRQTDAIHELVET